jgi:RES domain-containing protein
VRVWRLCKKKHAAFDGEGARRAGGRWNRKGTAVVYASESLALAVLELLVHVDAALLPDDLVAAASEIPDALAIARIEETSLPRGWRAHPAPQTLARLGTEWADSLESAVLSVPSALVPRERNFLLNPAHHDFRKIQIGPAEPFRIDTRLRPARHADAR